MNKENVIGKLVWIILIIATIIGVYFGGVLLGRGCTRQKTITETKNRATISLTKEEKIKKHKMALAILDAILAEGRTAPVEFWGYEEYLADVDSIATGEEIAQYTKENKNECSLFSLICSPAVYPDAYFNKNGKFILPKPYKNCMYFFDCFPSKKRFTLVEKNEI